MSKEIELIVPSKGFCFTFIILHVKKKKPLEIGRGWLEISSVVDGVLFVNQRMPEGKTLCPLN